MYKTLITLWLFSLSISLNAMTVSHYADAGFRSYNEPTHIFVIGYAGGLSDQFFRTAVGKAQRYHELYPQHQIVVIGPQKIDEKSKYYDEYPEYQKRLRELNLTATLFDEKWLTGPRLIPILEKFSRIETLEFLSHSAAHHGVGLDEVPTGHAEYPHKRLNSKTPGLKSLKDNLSKDAYMIIHGCNSGFIQAPEIASLLGVPTAGSLSYTNFQELFQNDQWYFNDSGKFPSTTVRAQINSLSYARGALSCKKGFCTRMKPEPYPYRGYWGKLTAGLSHYKFFCGQRTPDQRCKKIIARSLLSTLTNLPMSYAAKRNEYKFAIKDYLCPDANRPLERESCFQKLESAELDKNVSVPGMARGIELNCDFLKCDVGIHCTDEAGSCKITHAPNNPQTKTMVNEYRAFLEGYDLLN